MAGMTDTPRQRRGSKLMGGAAPITEAGIIDQSAGAASIVTDPPVHAADVVPAPPAGSQPDNAAVLLDPTLTGEPDAPQPIVSAAPVLAMEPSAIDVAKADARAERIETGMEPGATGDAALDAVAAQPPIAIEGETRSAAAVRGALQSALADGVTRGHRGDVISVDEMFAAGGVPPLGVIADVLELLAIHDPDALDYLGERYFSRGVRSSTDRPIANHDDTITVIAVTGPAQGRRRAGMSFGTQARLFLANDLSEAAITALRADPALAVSINEVDANEVDDMTFDVYPSATL